MQSQRPFLQSEQISYANPQTLTLLKQKSRIIEENNSSTCALVTSGARNWESFKSSQISALVPSPLGNRAAASRTEKK